MECYLTKLLGPSVPWSYFMPVDMSSGNWVTVLTSEKEHHWQDDFVSLAILRGLNRYLAKELGKGNKLLVKKGRPYLDYAIPKVPSPGLLTHGRWDLDTIRLLLQHGCNPNQVFEDDTSPWQYVLTIVQTRLSAEDFSVEAEDPESYFRVDGIRPQTSCSTYLGSLFELMLKYGGDSYARVT